MQTQSRNVALLFIGIYLILRMGLDFFWRELSVYYSYAFELAFVGAGLFFYRGRFRLGLNRRSEIVLNLILAFFAGHLGIQCAKYAGLDIPFDPSHLQTVIALLIIAPLLEEMIYRFVLWESLAEFFKKPAYLLITTSILFGLAHFQALPFVGEEWRSFVLFQSLYTILLALAIGWRRLETRSILPCFLIHFGFNLGAYTALF